MLYEDNKRKQRKRIFSIFSILILLITITPVVTGIYLNDIEDIDVDSAINCNFLHYNGSMWVNYDLWNESITWYNPHIFINTITANSYFGDGGNLTNITLSLPSFITSKSHPHNQDLNTTDNINFATITSVFFGDGGNITNISATIPIYLTSIGHPHNQDINTTSSPTFNDLTLTAFPYLDKDYRNDMTSFIGHPHNQDLNTTNAVTFLTVDTGQGANELYDMNQNVQTVSNVQFYSVTCNSVDTGQGANELYDMNQNVQTTDSPSFNDLILSIGDSQGYIYADTSDGSDNNMLSINGGGGAYNPSRGAFVGAFGNEYAGQGGWLVLSAGTVANSVIQFIGGSGGEVARFNYTSGYYGVGDVYPDYRVELPNTASTSGRGRANQWATYSDNRTKYFLGELPNDKTMEICNQTKIQYYNPINNTQDKNGTIIFGTIDTSKIMIGVDVQDLYYRMLSVGWDAKLVAQLIYKPINQLKDYWSIDYHALNLILIEACRIAIAENIQHTKNIENFLKNYGYTPLNWDFDK